MSAGSKTNPGGYSVSDDSLEQFSISDERSPDEVAQMLSLKGYEPVWKDWDSSYHLKSKFESSKSMLSDERNSSDMQMVS